MFLSSRSAMDDRSPWGNFWFEPVSVRSSAGVRVSAETAMRLSAVYACVRVLSETFAVLPFKLYRRDANNAKIPATDHWLYPLIARQPNEYQNGFEWREMLEGHLCLRGNAYNRTYTNGRGEITELVPIHPDNIRVEPLVNGGYRYRQRLADGSEIVLTRDQVWHLRGLSSDGVMGLSVIEVARESIGMGLAAQEYGARFFRNDARPGGWIEHPGTFKDKAARDTFRESWQNAQTGGNRHKVGVLEFGMKFHELGMKNNDAQFLETRQFQVADIARLFRVPPHLIGDLSKATFSNIEQQSLEFITNTMTPWAERWEASIEADLLLEGDQEELEVEFDFSRFLRGDQTARSAYYQSGIQNGWLTRNEARASENRNPLPGLDEPLQPLNMVTVKDAEEDDEALDAGQPPAPGDSTDKGEPQTPPPPPGRPKKQGSAWQERLVLAVAGRVVRKETQALRRACWTDGGGKAAGEFYAKHRAYVASSMGCSAETAAQWCDQQLAEALLSSDIETTLRDWEDAAPAHLAALVAAEGENDEA